MNSIKAKVRLRPNGSEIVENACTAPCRIERGMRFIGRNWKGSIVWQLQDGPVGFNDPARQFGGASNNIVALCLKETEAMGRVERKVFSTRPVAVAHEIARFGRSSLRALEQLKDRAEENGL